MLDVIVADDDPDYRLLIRLALEHEPDLRLAGEAGDADALLDLVVRHRPGIVLVDASLPRAVATAARLHAAVPDSRIVLTSSLPTRAIATTVVAAGAVGALAKDVPAGRVPDAIREVAAFVAAAERAVCTVGAGLEHDRTSPRRSRQLARSMLTGWCNEDVLASVELLISELVANGVEHAESDVDVRIAVSASSIRVEVNDRSAELPVVRSPDLDSPNGRGLRIVDNAATRWGVQARRTGKCVWFELPRVLDAAGR